MMVVPAIKTIKTSMTDITLPITARMSRASATPFLVGLVTYLSIIADGSAPRQILMDADNDVMGVEINRVTGLGIDKLSECLEKTETPREFEADDLCPLFHSSCVCR
jgi:hypothetical protein